MNYFTAELYRNFNHSDRNVSRAAAVTWRTAVQEYRVRLRTIESSFPNGVRQLAATNFHDHLVLTREFRLPVAGHNGTSNGHLPWQFPIPVFIILLSDPEHRDRLHSVMYCLRSEPRVVQHESAHPFHPQANEWRYDELDFIEGTQSFVHRILFGDGMELEISFYDVMLFDLPLSHSIERTVLETTS